MTCLAHMRGQCIHRLVFWKDDDLHILRDLHPLTLWRACAITITKTARWTTAVITRAITAWRAALSLTTRTESATRTITTRRWATARAITARRRTTAIITTAKSTTTATAVITTTALRPVF